MKIFLGGTCNGSTWRDELIPLLTEAGIDYFNPVVEDWTPECQAEEIRQKADKCDIHLYVITKEMAGVFSIAEAIDSVHQKDKSCFFQVVPEGFDSGQLKSLKAVVDMVENLGGVIHIGNDFNWIPDLLFGPIDEDIFQKIFNHCDAMTFGLAIEAVRTGKKIAREGWNGKRMFVVYQKGYPDGIPCNKQTADAWGMKEGDLFRCEPYLQIKMVNGSHSMWVPSINDVLAEDWQIVEVKDAE